MSYSKPLFIFPGQGSQYRGMGSDLLAEFPLAREIYARASDQLGYDLENLCVEDPEEKLGKTRYTQPALLAHEIACFEVFRELTGDGVRPIVMAGHSLGEYSALVASGSLSFESGLELVSRRGELMSEFGTGGMVATTLDYESAAELSGRYFCGIGGCNLPDQTVIAGQDEDLDILIEDMQANYKGKRAFRLATEGAFHTHLMVEAAMKFRPILEQASFSAPVCPIMANYTGLPHETTEQAIRSRLFFQLFNPVRWFACLSEAFAMGVDVIVEFGGGIGKSEEPITKRPNLEGIVKKALKNMGHDAEYLPAINVVTLQDAASILK